MYTRCLSFLFIVFLCFSGNAQLLKFAHVTDTHIGGSTSVEDLELTVKDINSQPDIEFVFVTGDVTEFGSEAELIEAHKILGKLNKPYYAVPGNHDSKWSESGCNDFVRIFGSETFSFERNGFLIVGTASGPNMRMAPGLIPREQLIFLDSVLTHLKNPDQPVFFINHYPLDESLSNYQKVINLLKSRNIQATFLGHGHANKLYDFKGIPGIMGRSNLRASSKTGGYNIGTIKGDTLYYSERIAGQKTKEPWCKIPLRNRNHSETAGGTGREEKQNGNNSEPVNTIWEFQENSDIGSGIAAQGNTCVYSTTNGQIIARRISDGKICWKYKTGGKIYSTPAISGNRVVCPSTDNNVYCLGLGTGKLLWSYKTKRAIVASPSISRKTVFVGSSEGVFRALGLKTGNLIWHYDSVKNFVETKPLLYQHNVYFGSWGNTFYALSRENGAMAWKREKYSNRMLSPAAVWPVAAEGKIFIVAPDRRMTALDAETGREIWDSGTKSCRESIGISADNMLVYIKNMTEGNVNAFYTNSNNQELAWECKAGLGYEIAPSPITERGNLVFIPTTGGVIHAINKINHQVAWKFVISNALINHILPVGKNRILVTTLDGKVACLRYK